MINLYLKKENDELNKKLKIAFKKEETLTYSTHELVYVLPCKKYQTKAAYTTYAGGVCTKDFTFIAGLSRHDECDYLTYTLSHSYPLDTTSVDTDFITRCSETEKNSSDTARPKESIEILEKGVFGGVIIDIFGHTLTETLSRLWFITETVIPNDIPILFTSVTAKIPEHFYEIISLLGIKDRIKIVEKPIFVKKIYIPEQSLILYSRIYYKQFNAIYNKIKNTIRRFSSYDKIYLTRTHYFKKDCIGEEIIEKIFENNGYTVTAPEEKTLEEQIYIISKAKEIVCTLGTLSHLAILFCSDDVKLTFLLREMEVGGLGSQLVLNNCKNCEINLVDTTYNFLPTTHAGGVFLLLPNEALVQYLRKNNLSFDKNICDLKNYGSYLYEYITRYIETYSNNGYAFKRIKELDIFDVVERISSTVLNKSIKRKDFDVQTKDSLRKKIKLFEKITSLHEIPDINTYIDKNKDLQILRSFIKDDILYVGDEKIYSKNLLSFLPRSSDENVHIEINEILPLLYVGDENKFDKYDILIFDNQKTKMSLSKTFLLNMINENIDAVLYKINIDRSIHNQFIKCHGERSWNTTIQILQRDPETNGMLDYIFNNKKFILAKNILIVRPRLYALFYTWYRPIIKNIINTLHDHDLKFIQNISERLMTLFFILKKYENFNVVTINKTSY